MGEPEVTDSGTSRSAGACPDTWCRAALDCAPFPLALLDSSRQVVLANRCWRKALGTPGPRRPGLEDLDDPPELAQGLSQVLTGALPRFHLDYEWEGRTNRLVATSVPDGQGLCLVHTDITEKVTGVRELAVQERRLRTAMEFAGLGIFDRDLVTGEEYHSENLEDILGFPGHSFADLLEAMHPDDLETFLRNAGESERTGGSHRQEFRIRLPDGSIRWLEGRARTLVANGRPIRVIGTTMDVTARKVAEQRFQFFMEHAPMLASVLDARGRIAYVNRALAEFLGASTGDLVGRTAEEVLPSEMHAACSESTSEVLRHGRRVQTRERGRDAAGREIDFLVMKFPVPPDSVGMICVDITQTVQADRVLRETQKRVTQLERLEALGRLAGGVAHDFNNLLSGILGFAELALSRLDSSDPLHQDLSEIRTSGRRTAELTAQLLAFSRHQVMEPRVLDLNQVVRDLGRVLSKLAGEDIDLQLRLGEGVPPILADVGQLQQVLVNLAVNAREAMPDGGRLTVATDAVDADGRPRPAGGAVWARLLVSDTGHGMTEDVRQRMFEPFFTTRAGRGTGLGLSTVYGIVSQSGGIIEVETAPSRGTEFVISLPAAEEVEPEAPPAPRAQPAAVPAGGQTILVVEDEPVVRKLMSRVLEMKGYRVMSAGTPTEALAFAERHSDPIHLLLSDVMLPVMTGPRLAERFLASHPESRVLYCSGYTNDMMIQHGINWAAQHFLQKPFTPEQLAAKVQEALAGS